MTPIAKSACNATMKLPEELARRLARQWANPDLREARLLRSDAWPVRLSIGKPAAGEMRNGPGAIRNHISAWQDVSTGRVEWQTVRYRDLAEQVAVPVAWELFKPSEWIKATADNDIRSEFERLSHIIGEIDPMFHSFMIRQRHLITHTPPNEIISAARNAMILQPGMACGAPLRALPLPGIDSKFFERNRTLMTRLLDIRFNGAVTDMGLEVFLDAAPQSDQWLLVIDLDGNLLPFRQMRLRDNELTEKPLPGSRVLIVENEQCRHVLPEVSDCVAILGAGLNLTWMKAGWLTHRQIAYWGDIDTWGLTMLAKAREMQPGLTPLLMTPAIFESYGSNNAVSEPVSASDQVPAQLSATEALLYKTLLATEKGRLEQEFLPLSVVQSAIRQWVRS